MKTIATVTLLLLILTSCAVGEPSEEPAGSNRLVYSEQVFDFGHVGIDFKLYHTYYIVNNGAEPVPIKSAATSCDCSHIRTTDSQIDPGDTAFFHLDFSTRNYYGPTTLSATVELDDPEYPKVKFYYLSTIGQWYGNLKPKPFSLFFLPGAGARDITLENRAYDQISWELADCSHTTFDIDMIKPEAARGETLTIKVTPAEGLASGTYSSSFTLHVTTAENQKPVILTIPVKIVKY